VAEIQHLVVFSTKSEMLKFFGAIVNKFSTIGVEGEGLGTYYRAPICPFA